MVDCRTNNAQTQNKVKIMTKPPFFNMWEQIRKNMIADHQFYIEQAKNRLLVQFSDISGEADKYADEYLKKISPRFDPEKHADGSFDDDAFNEGQAHYEMLDDMLKRTRMSVVAGMFHEWDKQLRDWIIKEMQGRHWYSGQEVEKALWKANYEQIIDFLEAFGWLIKSKPYYTSLDKCRLFVNVYKHGNGGAFDDIKAKHPKSIRTLVGATSFSLEYANHKRLIITEDDIDEFSNAIINFWKDVPEWIYEKENMIFPSWYNKAYKKDRLNQQ